MNKFPLLRTLCGIHAPSGNECAMTQFLLDYVAKQSPSWKIIPRVFSGNEFQESVVLVFGTPRTAVFAHIDNVGFMTRYENQLTRVGAPAITPGCKIRGTDSLGDIRAVIETDDDDDSMLTAGFNRNIDPGTDFSFVCDFRENDPYIQSCYIDNRLGVWVALRLAETLTDGVLVFSSREEHGGGSAGFLAGFLYQEFGLRQALICDITWVTEGVHHGKGVVVSLRDSGIPRRTFISRIRSILDLHGIPYQVEVESTGGSDGNEIQKSPYPFEWCFIGAPESGVHSPDEKVHTADIVSMLDAYRLLLDQL